MISSFFAKLGATLLLPFTMSLGLVQAPQQIPVLQHRLATLEAHFPEKTSSFGAVFNPAGGLTYRLGSSIGVTNNSVQLSSFKNRSNINLTMTTLNTSVGYGTIDPQNPGRSEFISFTGVTQNSDGTALLTGVTRGLSDIYPFSASSTLSRPHPGQSIFILSDSPSLFSEYAVKKNDETVTGTWTYTTGANPKYSSNPSSFGPLDFVNYQTLINTAISGAATSSFSNMGLVQLATKEQMAAGTASSSEGRPLVPSTKYSTTTYNPGNAVNVLPVTDSTGTIDNLFIATSTADTYRFAGPIFLNGTTTLNATTTIAAASSTSPLCINSLCAGWQSTPAASSSILMTTGGTNADVTWSPNFARNIGQFSSPLTVASNASTTVMTCTLPANALNRNGVLRIHAGFDSFGVTLGSNMIFALTANGSPIGYASSTPAGSNINKVAGGTSIPFDAYITASSTVQAAQQVEMGYVYQDSVAFTVSGLFGSSITATTFDPTVAQTIALVYRWGMTGAQTQIAFKHGYCELVR